MSNVAPIADPNAMYCLWRYGDNIVLHKRLARFPARCVSTNRTDNLEWHVFDMRLLPNSPLLTVAQLGAGAGGLALGGAMGGSIAGSMLSHAMSTPSTDPTAFNVTVALAPDWSERTNAFSAWGLRLVLGGIAACVLGIVAAVMVASYKLPDAFGYMTFLPIFGGPLAAIAGGICYVIASQPPFKITLVRPEYVWVEGASPEFVASLPIWPSELKPLTLFSGLGGQPDRTMQTMPIPPPYPQPPSHAPGWPPPNPPRW